MDSTTPMMTSQSAAPHSPALCRVAVATTNLHKAREIEGGLHLLGLSVTVLTPSNLEEVEETGETFAANASLKLDSFYASGHPLLQQVDYLLADDSGYVVDALQGWPNPPGQPFPGVYSNRWLTPALRNRLLDTPLEDQAVTPLQRCQAILALMQGETRRTARYGCALALLHLPTGQRTVVEGYMPLWVTEQPQPQGEGGFGYDPINHPLDETGHPWPQTVAQLPDHTKQAMSHRAQALKQLVALF